MLGSHLGWVLAGCKVLDKNFGPFFKGRKAAPSVAESEGGGLNVDTTKAGPSSEEGAAAGGAPEGREADRWLSMRFRRGEPWVWWVIGGYYASTVVFGLSDLVNQHLLPEEAFDVADSVVREKTPRA